MITLTDVRALPTHQLITLATIAEALPPCDVEHVDGYTIDHDSTLLLSSELNHRLGLQYGNARSSYYLIIINGTELLHVPILRALMPLIRRYCVKGLLL